MLFLQRKIGDVELKALSKNETEYLITITPTNEIPSGEEAPIQLYNVMFRKVTPFIFALSLQMQLIHLHSYLLLYRYLVYSN